MIDEERVAYIAQVRRENAARQDELEREIAEREVNGGPEPMPWFHRFREKQPQRRPETEVALRHQTEAKIIRLIDRRMREWVRQERAETERRIAEVVSDLEAQAADALEEVERALNNVAQRAHTDLTNSDAARRAAVDAMHARYDVLEARIKLLLASENAQVIEPSRPTPRRTN
jgi:hypothetical protein